MNLETMLDQLTVFAANMVLKLLGALFVLVLGRMVIKFIMRTVREGGYVRRADPTAARFLTNALNVVLHLILTVSVIAILGVPMASVITVIASAGVAIGLALQGALGNLAGGIMILIFRPFRIEDYIEVGDFGGTVKDIGIFYTVLQTPDNRTVTIPNGTVMAKEVVNFSLNDTRRVDFVFPVAYGTEVERVKKILLEEAGKHDMVMDNPAPVARLSRQNNSSLDFMLRVWTAKSDYWTVHFDLLEAINNRFVQENISVPFNQLDVHLDAPAGSEKTEPEDSDK